MRVPVGPVADVPDDRCVAAADGKVVVVRVGGELRAFENRCLHQDSLLAGGVVRNGVLSCPLHFWRYRVEDGSLVGSKRSLPRFPIDVVNGEAYVLLPDEEPDLPLRQQLLDRARNYDRDAAWQAEHDDRETVSDTVGSVDRAGSGRIAVMDSPVLVARPVADSLDELLGSADRQSFVPADARSPAGFERVDIDGERCVVKYVHPDFDFTMRASGDLGCRPRRVWEAGLMDLAPDTIDHATLGVARWGRNGWGAALLMRDVSSDLLALGDEPIDEELHAAFLDAIAALATPLWGFQGDMGLLPHRLRWAWFGPEQLASEERLGFPEPVPRIATEGWQRFADRAPADVVDSIESLRRDPQPLSEALQATPQTFVHGDWKIGNLGYAADKRVVLLDWAYPGEGPVCHELAWYLSLNRARIPRGHTKESTIDDFRAALERHGIATAGWWDRQLTLCLTGALVQFGWEKAFGDDDELNWWIDAARPGLAAI